MKTRPEQEQPVTIRSFLMTGVAGMGLAACQGIAPMADVTRLIEPPLTRSHNAVAPPGAAPGTCWGMEMTPAEIETVTEHVLLQPAEVTTGGRVLEPALYKTETQQRIVKERTEIWFETPCSAQMDTGFIETLQRALKARDLYHGPINGHMDHATRRAVRRYQAPQGLDSAILSLAAARKLGLIAYPRPAPAE
ncbi:peptidoglycan-binding domain-containing protein [Actibacterium sp. D379-3]